MHTLVGKSPVAQIHGHSMWRIHLREHLVEEPLASIVKRRRDRGVPFSQTRSPVVPRQTLSDHFEELVHTQVECCCLHSWQDPPLVRDAAWHSLPNASGPSRPGFGLRTNVVRLKQDPLSNSAPARTSRYCSDQCFTRKNSRLMT
jgi:hypothetical protein